MDNYYGFIYITTNNINGKKYIGKKVYDKYNHWKTYLGSGIYLNRAIQKYGRSNFSKEIIENCTTLQELNEREIYWIKYYDAVASKNYYNCAEGGDGGNVISGFTEEQLENYKNKLSIARKGKVNLGAKNGVARKVICLNNMMIFNTIKEAGDYGNTNSSNVQLCCKNPQKHKTAGTHPITNERLQWSYYDPNIEYTFTPFVNDYSKRNHFKRKVIRLTDMKEYDSISDAAKDNNLRSNVVSYRCNQEKITDKHLYDVSFAYIE